MSLSSAAVLDNLRSFLARQNGLNGTDSDLLQRFTQTGDGDAFAALLERHGPMVLGLARRVVGDGQWAEDVFQAAFLLLARKAHTLRRPEALPCWLQGVTLRLALRARRSRQHLLQRERQAHPPRPRTPLEELTAQELLTALDEELGRLPEDRRAVLILCCLEGLSQEEAARRLGCSAGAVKGQLERGRRQLRLRLHKRGLLPAVLSGALLTTSAVRPALARATLHAVKVGAASPAAVVLLRGALWTALMHKLKLVCAVVLLAVSGGLGMALCSHAARDGAPPAVSTAEPARREETPAPKVDRFGDPLPEGALARLGTLRLRAFQSPARFSADGKAIITVTGGRQVKCWDADTGKLRGQCQLPVRISGETCLSSDGRLLAVRESGFDSPIVIWDVHAGKPLHQLPLPQGQGIFRAVFSSGGKMLAVAHTGGTETVVYLWRLETGEQRVLKGVGSAPESLAFSPDGKLLAAASGQHVICWSVADGEERWRAEGGHNICLAFTPDGRTLIASRGVYKRSWRAWHAATGKPNDQLKLPDRYLCAELAVAPDGRTLVFALPLFLDDVEHRVHLWDMHTGKLLHTLNSKGWIGSFAPDGKSFLTNDGVLQRWQLGTGRPLLPDTHTLGHAGQVVRAVYSPDGRRLASSAQDGAIRLWDLATARPLHILRGHECEADGLAFTPDGKHLVSGGKEGELRVWDAEVGKEVRRIPLHDLKSGEKKLHVWRLHVAADGRSVVVLGYEPDAILTASGVLTTWDLATGQRISRAEVSPCDGFYSAFSPDGQLLASGGELLETATGERWMKLEGEPAYPGHFAFSSDGRLVAGLLTHVDLEGNRATTRMDGVRIWEAFSGQQVRLLRSDWVGQLAFSPDGRYLAAAGLDGLRLWELASGQVVVRHQAHERVPGSYGLSFASCLSFAPDGRSLATGHPDSTVLLWGLTPSGRPATAADLPRLWEELASPEASRAYAASGQMTDSPRETLRFLHRHLQAATPAPADQTQQLLAGLDSEDFANREAAAAELRRLGDRAKEALRRALAASPSLEKRRRVEKLLRLVDASPTSQMLRELRAVAVLERIGSEEARKLLKELAAGAPDVRQTREAKGSLRRLALRFPKPG